MKLKLSRIYSNKTDIFSPIDFNEGLNVIFAKVESPKDSSKDSHNLGKTLLISLIDFMMLKGWSDKLFLHKHSSKFTDFVFYLEIKLNSGKYLTIRRSVANNSKIFFKNHDDKLQDFSSLDDSQWDESDMSFKKAKSYLNEKLNLFVLGEWGYRTGLNYFLRNQKDWSDVFQIDKFSRDKARNWTPYLAKIIGLDDKPILLKFELDENIQDLEDLKKKQTKLIGVDPKEYDTIKGYIQVKEAEILDLNSRIEKFNFFKEEISTNTELVQNIEDRVSEINEYLYNITYEIEQIVSSLKNKSDFDIQNIVKLFEEMKVNFPSNLKKDFDDLNMFKQKITTDREESLKKRTNVLEKKKVEYENELSELNTSRENKLNFLRSHDTFKKYRERENRIQKLKTDVFNLNHQLKNLDVVNRYDEQIDLVKEKKDKVIKQIDTQIKEGNKTTEAIRYNYNQIVKKVLNVDSIISAKLNENKNPVFENPVISNDDSESVTAEGDGTTYKKILCAAFDLAVLMNYSDGFYRFVYHDGILEGLDDRKKNNLLTLISEICENQGIQYIMTVIDSDLPRDSSDNKIYFSDEVVIKELNDQGNNGRLFKMNVF